MAKTLEELEADLKAITDQVGGILDKVEQKGFVPAFRCGHSGLWYPSDYVKQWGRFYGFGLGPTPVSECLDSEYDVSPPAVTPDIRSIDQLMHPVRFSMAQMDFDLVAPATLESLKPILAIDDPYMERRANILRQKQLANPRGRIRNLHAAWLEAGKGAR